MLDSAIKKTAIKIKAVFLVTRINLINHSKLSNHYNADDRT